MGSFLICSVALVDGAVALDGTLADVTLAGSVTFSPASSSRDGERGAFIVVGALAVICGVFAGAILALADVILAGALVTFSPASSSRDGGADTLARAFIVAGALVVICGIILGAILGQIATEPKMHK
jgi:hypothetical protein